MKRQLRILRYIVQPVLVWDDGELTDGPTLEPVSISPRDLPDFDAGMKADLPLIAERAEISASETD